MNEIVSNEAAQTASAIPPEELARLNRVLDEWCARVGRDPQEIERSMQIFAPRLDKVDEYLAAGITHFIRDASGPDYDLTPLYDLIAWRDKQAIASV